MNTSFYDYVVSLIRKRMYNSFFTSSKKQLIIVTSAYSSLCEWLTHLQTSFPWVNLQNRAIRPLYHSRSIANAGFLSFSLVTHPGFSHQSTNKILIHGLLQETKLKGLDFFIVDFTIFMNRNLEESPFISSYYIYDFIYSLSHVLEIILILTDNVTVCKMVFIIQRLISNTNIDQRFLQRFLPFQKQVIQNNTAYDKQQIQSLCKHLFG